nr:MAG TPA: hypothetical protein [Caudoviricetes sp.]
MQSITRLMAIYSADHFIAGYFFLLKLYLNRI